MRHLVVGGTGAVGTSWSYFLSQAGDSVSSFVRPKYKAEILGNGSALTVHNLARQFRLTFVLFFALFVGVYYLVACTVGSKILGSVVAFAAAMAGSYFGRAILPKASATRVPIEAVVTTVQEAEAAGVFDYIWVCLASDKLAASGDMIRGLAKAFPDATIAMVCANNRDIDFAIAEVATVDGSVAAAGRRIINMGIPLAAYGLPLEGAFFSLCEK